MSLRPPTDMDFEQMQQALGLLTSYAWAIRDQGDFTLFLEEVRKAEADNPRGALVAMVQLTWLLLLSLERQGVPKEKALQHFGVKFAQRREE